MKRLAVIDGKSVFYRGYYAMPGLATADGTPTGGVYGFVSLAIELIKKLGDFPEEIDQAARERAPHRIARYVHEAASLFHTFYNQCRIIGAEPDVQQARLGLVAATQQVLRRALGILGVDAPEKM